MSKKLPEVHDFWYHHEELIRCEKSNVYDILPASVGAKITFCLTAMVCITLVVLISRIEERETSDGRVLRKTPGKASSRRRGLVPPASPLVAVGSTSAGGTEDDQVQLIKAAEEEHELAVRAGAMMTASRGAERETLRASMEGASGAERETLRRASMEGTTGAERETLRTSMEGTRTSTMEGTEGRGDGGESSLMLGMGDNTAPAAPLRAEKLHRRRPQRGGARTETPSQHMHRSVSILSEIPEQRGITAAAAAVTTRSTAEQGEEPARPPRSTAEQGEEPFLTPPSPTAEKRSAKKRKQEDPPGSPGSNKKRKQEDPPGSPGSNNPDRRRAHT